MFLSRKSIIIGVLLMLISFGGYAQRIHETDSLSISSYQYQNERVRLSKDPRFLDREIQIDKFVPKGQWMWGASFSYSETNADNYKFVVIENLGGSNYSFSISPYVSYFLKDNKSVGVRFQYNRSMLKVNSMDLNISDDINLNVDNYYNLKHTYMGYLTYRTYMNLGNSKRFGLFNEVRFGLGGGQGKLISGTGEDMEGTYQTITKMELGIVPGLVAFLTNELALEASVNILGFSYAKYNQTTNQIYKGSFDNSSANFKVDIFSINIGLSFYIFKLNPLKAYGIGIKKAKKDKNKK